MFAVLNTFCSLVSTATHIFLILVEWTCCNISYKRLETNSTRPIADIKHLDSRIQLENHKHTLRLIATIHFKGFLLFPSLISLHLPLNIILNNQLAVIDATRMFMIVMLHPCFSVSVQ